MFRTSVNSGKKTTKKKKLLFISSITSSEISSLEPHNEGIQKETLQISPKISSLSAPTLLEKKNKIIFNNIENECLNQIKKPIRRIFFKLHKVNLLKTKKGKRENKPLNSKKNKLKKIENDMIKHKQKYLILKHNNISYNNKTYSAGRWKDDEHKRFIDAIIRYGNNWRQIQKYVGTRSCTQTRSHAQKFFEKLKKLKIFKKEKYDLSKNCLKILHDIMKNLSKEEYNQTLSILHSLSYDRSQNLENKKTIITGTNGLIDSNLYTNENYCENVKNDENNNININNEENSNRLKILKEGYCFIENNNNRILNEDYLLYNNNLNYNNIYINIFKNDFPNCENKIYERKESDIFNEQINLSYEKNINVKDIKEPNNNLILEDFNLDSNIYNNSSLHDNNKILMNKFGNKNEDKIGYKELFTNIDFLFNQSTSRKMSLDEKSSN